MRRTSRLAESDAISFHHFLITALNRSAAYGLPIFCKGTK
jgi:hypothetical protein